MSSNKIYLRSLLFDGEEIVKNHEDLSGLYCMYYTVDEERVDYVIYYFSAEPKFVTKGSFRLENRIVEEILRRF